MTPEKHPVWQHAWLHADDPFAAFEVWRRHRWPSGEHEQLQFYIEVVGAWPDHDNDVLRAVNAYSHDPVVERLRAMQTPHVYIDGSALDPNPF